MTHRAWIGLVNVTGALLVIGGALLAALGWAVASKPAFLAGSILTTFGLMIFSLGVRAAAKIRFGKPTTGWQP